MGGLINSSTVKGDLWMVEAGGSLSCYPLATTAEGPGPRVGHASLLVGNAFIVYGGDTKIEESDSLDETLYLLNTCTLRLRHSAIYILWSISADFYSNATMVESTSSRISPIRALWPHFEHSGVQDLHLRRPSRRHLYERSLRLRPEPIADGQQPLGDAHVEQRQRRRDSGQMPPGKDKPHNGFLQRQDVPVSPLPRHCVYLARF